MNFVAPTFYSPHSLCVPILRDVSPSLQSFSTPSLLWDPQGFLFLCFSPFSFLHILISDQAPQSFLGHLTAELNDFYSTILNFQAFSGDFLFLWNFSFEFTEKRLILGSAWIPFLFQPQDVGLTHVLG